MKQNVRTHRLIPALILGGLLVTGCPDGRSPLGVSEKPANSGGNGGRPSSGGSSLDPSSGGTPTKPPSTDEPALPLDPGPLPAPPPVADETGGTPAVTSSFLYGSVLAPSPIISNNGGAIISNNGSAIISNNGSAIISNNGGAIISNNGGAIISNNGGTYRVLDAFTSEGLLKNAFLYLTNRDEKFFRNTESGKAFTATTGTAGGYSFPITGVRGFPVNQDVVVNAVVNGNLRMTGYLQPTEGQLQLNLNLATTAATEFLRGDAVRNAKALGSYDKATLDQVIDLTDDAMKAGHIEAVKTVTDQTGEPVTVGTFDLRMDHVYNLRNQYVIAMTAIDATAQATRAAALKAVSDAWKTLLGYRPAAVTSLVGNGKNPVVDFNPGTFNIEGDERGSVPHVAGSQVPVGYPFGVAVAKNGDIFYVAYTEFANSGHIRWLQRQSDGSYRVTSVTNTRLAMRSPSGLCIENEDAGTGAALTLLVTDPGTERVYRYHVREDAVKVSDTYTGQVEVVAGNTDKNFLNMPDHPYSDRDVDADGDATVDATTFPYPEVSTDFAYESRWRLSEEGENAEYAAGHPFFTPGDKVPSPARFASLNNPLDVKVDEDKNIYIADTFNHRIRMIPAADGQYFGYREPVDSNDDGVVDSFGAVVTMKAGHIYTIAGNPEWNPAITPAGNSGGWYGDFAGDTGLAQEAKLDQPNGLAWHDGYLYVSDFDNNRVRRISRDSGRIDTVVGGATVRRTSHPTDHDYEPGYTEPGTKALDARLAFPTSVAFDPRPGRHALYISDTNTGRILVVDKPDGTGTVQVVGGRGKLPTVAPKTDNWLDGDALNWADLFDTQFLAIDNNGNVIFSDLRHRRIRQIWRQWE